MAAPLELFCWKGDYGLPSVDVDCLTVLAYAKFAGAPLKVHKITNPWRSPTGTLPALKTREGGSISQPSKIIIHLRKQKYNADYDLSAKEGADTLAFVSLLEEKLLPALLYRDAFECMTLLSQRLGSQKFFFGDFPSSLDAYVFAHLAPLLKIKLPNGKLQQHLNSLNNLQQYCTNILALYFPSDAREAPGHKIHAPPDSSDFGNEPHKRRNQILSALFAVGAMLGYAILTGILTIKRERPQLKNSSHDDEDDEDED
ncbi:metaxin-1-like [Sinocyclocheilus rhinocerous]|uniref:metaxin-1-like n=1 Tax=Sinocyclocheilus rhinocerous TaxID=307959 RepID=UPI0007BA76F8|nr:PREDICTED: metaxin-1-like [Sinocyclocheilus rhinocerous]